MIIPCKQNRELRRKIEEFSEDLKAEAHTIGTHGLDEREFHDSGLFRGAIERIRGQFSATMRDKREFVTCVLNFMRDGGFIREWESAGESNRHDYKIVLNSQRIAIVELKGCLDGNNTNIFERPPHANEFAIWSLCTNPGADPRHNAWSGLHTRLSAEIIFRKQAVDGVIVWDSLCGTIGRPCPKIHGGSRLRQVARYRLPPPCIYVFPSTIPSPRNNPRASAQRLCNVGLLQAFHDCFGGNDRDVNYVDMAVENRGADIVRTTTVRRGGMTQRTSTPTPVRRA